jgi:GNAT superfamily N-acetyltransferase
MHPVDVISAADKAEFHNFPKRLYNSDTDWTCPLDDSVESVFNPLTNPKFQNGEAVRWLLKERDLTIGRIAAFIDRTRSSLSTRPTGGIGLFEVIEDRKAAFLLFDKAKEWHISRGIEAIEGPISFNENFSDWGLLADGYTRQGYGMPYNKRYYRQFYEEYGFRNYYEQYTFHRSLRDEKGKITDFPERLLRVAEWLISRSGYSFRHFDFAATDKFINDLCTIYNETWGQVKKDFTPISPGYFFDTLQKIRPFLDEELAWFAYFHDKPIGFFVLVPDFNQMLKHFHGKISFWNIPRMFYYKLIHEMNRLEALAGGVHPSFQNRGVEAALFYKLYQSFEKKPWYRELEIGWIGDYNPRMLATCEALGALRFKTHITFKYLIDRSIPFIRFKDEMAGIKITSGSK